MHSPWMALSATRLVCGCAVGTSSCWRFATETQRERASLAVPNHAGKMIALSCVDSLKMTHGMRAVHDAILIGIGTALADDPSLTCRLVPGPSPVPVVLDRDLRLPPTARLLRIAREAGRQVVVLHGKDVDGASQARARALVAAGATCVGVRMDEDGHAQFASIWDSLRALGLWSIMVEGGAGLITSLLQQAALQPQLVQLVAVTVAPVFVGGIRAPSSPLASKWPTQGKPLPSSHFLGLVPVGPPAASPSSRGVTTFKVGRDIVCLGRLDSPALPSEHETLHS